jgi:hypothetical protein
VFSSGAFDDAAQVDAILPLRLVLPSEGGALVVGGQGGAVEAAAGDVPQPFPLLRVQLEVLQLVRLFVFNFETTVAGLD